MKKPENINGQIKINSVLQQGKRKKESIEKSVV